MLQLSVSVSGDIVFRVFCLFGEKKPKQGHFQMYFPQKVGLQRVTKKLI